MGDVENAVCWRWPDPKTGPYEVFVRMGDLHGRFEVLAVEVRSIGDRLKVTSTLLRNVRLEELATKTAAFIQPLLSDPTDIRGVTNAADMGEEWRRRREEALAPERQAFERLRGRVKARAPVTLEDVAAIYSKANAQHLEPTKTVAEKLGITYAAAAHRVQDAREARLLPKTTRGRATSPSCTVCGDPLPALSVGSLICARCEEEGGTAPGYLNRLDPGEAEIAQVAMARRIEKLGARAKVGT